MATTNTITNIRFTGCIDLLSLGIHPNMVSKVASYIIGKGGSNIKKYNETIPGSYVRLQSSVDSETANRDPSQSRVVYISARNAIDTANLYQMIIQDIHSFQSKNQNSFTVFVPCDPCYLSHIFGKQGHRIKGFINQVGNSCKIVWDTDKSRFTISANTLDACNHAKTLITTHISKVSNRHIPLTESNHLKGIFSTSSNKKRRWDIREYLSKKVDDQGNLLFQPTETRSGAHAVPWSAVDEEIRKLNTQKSIEKPTTEQAPSNKENKHVDPFEEKSTLDENKHVEKSTLDKNSQTNVPDNWEDNIVT